MPTKENKVSEKSFEKEKHVSVSWVVLCLPRSWTLPAAATEMSVIQVNLTTTEMSFASLLDSDEELNVTTLLYINSSSTISSYFNSSDVAVNALDSLMNVLIAMVLVILILITAIGKWMISNSFHNLYSQGFFISVWLRIILIAMFFMSVFGADPNDPDGIHRLSSRGRWWLVEQINLHVSLVSRNS